ncbi:hypothetical protein Bca52824_086376 [Brassica carinata]|uniref:Uncharacterized protein n=1 Tax=Brassica carinata TaxID=52824 RepID=A0A8X7P9V2_BRACI|nr:hypothetical protein Bca52824_086376 [Brassica carinata]
MKKVLRVYGGVLRLVRLLPADTRPYYAKYARENFVNYREVDVSETPSTNSINELTITLSGYSKGEETLIDTLTRLFVQKVFPEAAAAMAGGDQTLDCDLPSDDSEDEEYDPDSLNDNADDEDGSDESKDIMDLPSDDSEDDDYDPDAPVPDEDKMQESSNSDNASDSEDLETSFKGNESNQQDEENPGR